ncbi:undecaprenyl-diphosphatase UppP [Candidatus Nomurabacteria bacterium]|nr:MAG: undecaprenyl-diphosphatase UppP [Candidatus Nomurabacteria bacterium]
MTILQSIVLGIIEGVTEFLPVSSTGHLILATRTLGIESTPFVESFTITIQVGALIAILFLFTKRLIQNWDLMKNIALAFIPTAIIGIVLYPFIKEFLLSNTYVVIYSLLFGGILIILFEIWFKRRAQSEPKEITTKNAILLGVFQTLAFIPGVSRSGAMIIGGLSMGITRKNVVEFSFLLGIPTLIAASGLDLIKTGFTFSSSEWTLLGIGFVSAFVSALFAVKIFIRFIEKHNFIGFGIYRILLALVFLFFVL